MSTLKVPVGPEDHIEGKEDASITLVEYGDYECPHCSVAFAIVPRIQQHYGDKLRFVYRNFPLTQIHPEAQPAAETAEFAGAHEKFWPMHDQLFENQVNLGTELYRELATDLDLNPRRAGQGAGRRNLHRTRPRRLHRRRAQRCQRNAYLLHQRPAPQWALRL